MLRLKYRDRIGLGLRIGNENVTSVPVLPTTFDGQRTSANCVVYEVVRVLPPKQGNSMDCLVRRVHDDDSSSETYLAAESTESCLLLHCFDKTERQIDAIQVLREEFHALRTLPFHPNLVNVRDLFETPSTMFLVRDQIPLGAFELSKGMKADRLEFLSPTRVQRLSTLFAQMCAAVTHLHVHGLACHLPSSTSSFVLIRNDLPEEGGIDYNARLSRSLFDDSSALDDTIGDLAASRSIDLSLTQSEDVLALGILLMEMLYGPSTVTSSSPTDRGIDNSAMVNSLCDKNTALSPELVIFFDDHVLCDPPHRFSTLQLGAWVEKNLLRVVACRSSPTYSSPSIDEDDEGRTREVYVRINNKLEDIVGRRVESLASEDSFASCTTSILTTSMTIKPTDLDNILNSWHNDEIYFLAELLSSDVVNALNVSWDRRTNAWYKHALHLEMGSPGNIKRVVRKLYTHVGAFPSTLFLHGTALTFPDFVYEGGFANIYLGDHDDGKIAIKRPRIHGKEHPTLYKKAWMREIFVMFFTSKFQHPNILPLIGLDSSIWAGDELPSILVPWMENGTITSYLKSRTASTTYEDLRKLMYGLASGLALLHTQGVVHGDLCGRNVLIDDHGVPLLADFGLSWFTNVTEVRHDQGSYPWQAPELLGVSVAIVHPDGPERTVESDIYAFACTLFEICTGQPPFYESSSFGSLLMRLRRGDRPNREPIDSATFWKPIPDWLWEIITRCWSQNPSARPSMLSIAEELGALSLDD